MKIVREILYEKFAEQGDPIYDMGIGIPQLYKDLEKRLREEFPHFVDGFDHATPERNYLKVNTFGKEYVKLMKKFFKDDLFFKFVSLKGEHYGPKKQYYTTLLRFKPKYNVTESLNEKFSEQGDPVYDMGIGIHPKLLKEIRKFYFSVRPADKEIKKQIGIDDYLWISAAFGKTEYVKALLNAGADVHTQDDWSLRRAVAYNHTDIVEELLKHGANPHANNDEAIKSVQDGSRMDIHKLLTQYTEKKVNEKFTEDSDPIEDMGIGAKFVYYRLSKSDQNSYVMYIYGDSFNVRDILKKFNFMWDDMNRAWKSRFSLPKELWEKSAPKMFEQIEKIGAHIVQPRGKLSQFDIDMERSFYIPEYDHWEYPYIPDGKGLKVYFKQWHHHAPVIGVTGKGSYTGRAVLKYDGYVFNKGSHMWERTYDKEDVDDLIKYFESRGYTVIDGRKKIYEKFTEEGDPVEDMGIGISAYIDQVKQDLTKIVIRNFMSRTGMTPSANHINRYTTYRDIAKFIAEKYQNYGVDISLAMLSYMSQKIYIDLKKLYLIFSASKSGKSRKLRKEFVKGLVGIGAKIFNEDINNSMGKEDDVMTQFLIESAIKQKRGIKFINKLLDNALHRAIQARKVNMILWLFNKGANPAYNKYETLRWALENDEKELVKEVLKHINNDPEYK
jgi:ankyrin repeat protein